MSDIRNKMKEIRKEFSIFEDPREKYVYLVDIAKKSPGINPTDQNDENKVYGCTSQAWIICEELYKAYNFHTDSDAMIVKGLLFILQRLFNGQNKEEILSINGDNILNEIGLGDSISSQRTNGFGAAIHKIQNELVA